MYRGKFQADPAAIRARKKTESEMMAARAEQPRRPAAPKESKENRGPRRHTIVFYSIYAACIVAFFFGLSVLMGELDKFLVKYEASQPDVKSQEVFAQLFSDPNWSEIYDMTELEDTPYDDKESFVTYMEAKVGEQKLDFVETSMGLSKDKKFIVRMDGMDVASFSLRNAAGAVAIPEWELGDVEVYLSYDEAVTVHSYPGYTVKVNGVALGEEQIIRTTSTHAEDYLPEGLHGARTVSYHLDGLLVTPTVTVTDETGAEMNLHFNEEEQSWSHDSPANTITDEQRAAFAAASKAYGRFMIADLGKQSLARYFTGNSYNAITQAELAWMQDFSGYEFGALDISEFYAYSDTWCSGRVNQILYVTRKNGTVKEYAINSTFFMEKQGSSWMVVEMTNSDVQAGKSQVRLQYMQDGKLLASQMVDSDAQKVTPPAVNVPVGKVFSGWFKQTVNEEGKTVMSLVFQANDSGEVVLPAGYTLEPMTLYARFENKGAE